MSQVDDKVTKEFQNYLAEKRRMKTMEEDGTNADDFEEFSSDDDYLSSDNSFDSDGDDESFTMSEVSSMSLLADEENIIQANYRASTPCILIFNLF